MTEKLTARRVIIRECSFGNDDFVKLYRIFKLTICPLMSDEEFLKYYGSDGFAYIDVSFYYLGKNLSGFCAAVFYKSTINGKKITIARSATGFVEAVRGGALDKSTTYGKYISYKWSHFSERMTLTIYALNPFVYSMVCKYTGIVYPRAGQPVPAEIVELKNNILNNANTKHRERSPFVVQLNFDLENSAPIRQQAFTSTNANVRFFVEKTGLEPQMALLIIIPVNTRNILLCLFLYCKYSTLKKLNQIGKKLSIKPKKNKNKLNCSLNQPAETGYANRKTL